MLVLAAVVVCGAVVIAPLAREPLVYLLFSVVCHQQPERSLWLAGSPMPVCARCAGIYFGVLMGLLFALPVRRSTLLAAIALLALDWTSEAMGLREPWVAVRWTTGCLAGLAGAVVFEEASKEWRRVRSANPA